MSSIAPRKTDVQLQPRETVQLAPLDHAPVHKLGELPATAICGNDITSSCLYVSALTALYAGQYAPLALLLVAGLLYFYRSIYAEVGDALPLNGGAYNCLLNTTSKFRASMAACMSILSYLATAVISANEAMHYAHQFWSGLEVITATIVLLALFAFLNIVGISESAIVAVVIFVFHLVTLVLFTLFGLWHLVQDPSTLLANWRAPLPYPPLQALYFGFSAALLGISGFESSANFIEQQKEGVFVKTLRNMWVIVSVFNPLIALLALAALPLAEISSHSNALLAHAGRTLAGDWFGLWIAIDATLVLSGAVLTSYVGTTGLLRRMTLDRCLPQSLLKENRWRGTSHRIILSFFILCVSILLVAGGNIKVLAGVYTISFLGVMALFAVGNLLLKINRRELPRQYRAGWGAVLVGLGATLLGLIGNIVLDPEYFGIFLVYFVPSALIVSAMLWRTGLLKLALFLLRNAFEKMNALNRRLSHAILNKIDQINSQGIVFFTKGHDRRSLNLAMLYVKNNELTKRLRVVHVYRRPEEIPPQLESDLDFLDDVYPEISVEFTTVQGMFGPELIQQLSEEWRIPKNYMFIGSPGNKFPYRISELGGVRLII